MHNKILLAEKFVKRLNISQNACPEKDSSLLSKILFNWFDEFAWKGYRKQVLNYDDLWDLDDDMQTAKVVRKFEFHWGVARKRPKK